MTTLTRTGKFCAFLIILLAMFISGAAIADEQNVQQNTNNLTSTLSNENVVTQSTPSDTASIMTQIISLIDAIKFKIQHFFDVSVAPKIMAIINAIETQCQNLIELINGPNPTDQDKINAIANNVESQRKSLWSYILPSTDQNSDTNSYVNNMDGINKKDNSFHVYAPNG